MDPLPRRRKLVILPLEECANVTVVHSGSPFEILRGRYVRQRFAPRVRSDAGELRAEL